MGPEADIFLLILQGFLNRTEETFMPYYADGAEKNKLMALYILRACHFPLNHEQLATALIENGAGNYFEISNDVLELEESGYIVKFPVVEVQLIFITEKGRELVKMFESTLLKTRREALDQYVRDHHDEYRESNISRVVLNPRSDGSVEVKLALIENNRPMCEIDIVLPNSKLANAAQRNWEENGSEVYMELLSKLITE